MNKQELKQHLTAALRPFSSAEQLHLACLYLKLFADTLLDPQYMSVEDRICYWRACYRVYLYLLQNRCLLRKPNPDQVGHTLAIYHTIDQAEKELSHVEGI